MKTDDLKEFAQLMIVLCDIYGDPGKPLSDTKLNIYYESLKDLSIEEVRNAVIHIMREKLVHVFPVPAEIREAAHGKVEDRAEFAFESLLNNLSYYESVEFEDGTIGKVVDAMGGWDKVNDWEPSERKWNRIEFVKLYKIYDAQGPWPAKKYIGAIEAHNGPKGYTEHIHQTIKVPAVSSITAGKTQRLRLLASSG